MTSYRLWPATNGDVLEGSAFTFDVGVEFEVTESGCQLTGYWRWIPSNEVADADGTKLTYRLYSTANGVTGTLVANSTVTGSGTLPFGQWTFFTLPVGIDLTAGTHYRAVLSYTGSGFGLSNTGDYWDSLGPGSAGITNGPLTAFNTTNTLNETQCSFNVPSTGTFPTSTAPSSNYWVDVEIALIQVVVVTTVLPNGEANVAGYSGTLQASSGTAPYTWTLQTGSLPAGLSLSNSGIVSGTPTAAGTSNFTVQATDAVGRTATGPISLTVYAAVSVATSSLPGASVGSPYTTTLTAAGGLAPFTWAVSTGSLPPGLTLAGSTGVISGTPTTALGYSFTVQVTDSLAGQASSPLSITVTGPLAILTSSLPNEISGTAYSQTLAASGGQAPYVWTLVAGALPAGLTLSTGGVISGMPTGSSAITAHFIVQAQDGLASTARQALSISATPTGGVTGWDLYSTLQEQASYAAFYKSQPPVACPRDGTPLLEGPAGRPGVLFCPFDGFQYPDDWDAETMSGM